MLKPNLPVNGHRRIAIRWPGSHRRILGDAYQQRLQSRKQNARHTTTMAAQYMLATIGPANKRTHHTLRKYGFTAARDLTATVQHCLPPVARHEHDCCYHACTSAASLHCRCPRRRRHCHHRWTTNPGNRCPGPNCTFVACAPRTVCGRALSSDWSATVWPLNRQSHPLNGSPTGRLRRSTTWNRWNSCWYDFV